MTINGTEVFFRWGVVFENVLELDMVIFAQHFGYSKKNPTELYTLVKMAGKKAKKKYFSSN